VDCSLTCFTRRDIAIDDYFLLVESLDTDVVAFAPMLASHHPRVIAVGEGNGDLLRVTLLLSEQCRMRRNIPMGKQSPKTVTGPLASALASVQVDFSTTDSPNPRPDTVQNDGISGRERKSGKDKDPNDLSDILIGIPLRDDHNNEKPAVQARKHGSNGGGLTPISISSGKSPVHADMTTLEVGMYVLLTGFCLAIGIFVISCVVYASKFRPVTVDMVSEDMGLRKDPVNGASGMAMLRDSRRPRESTTNAHDWVWLGRATMDRAMPPQQQQQQQQEIDQRDARIRITSNPLPLNYVDPDDAVLQMNSFDNPNAIELPTKANGINSATYTKRDRMSYQRYV
jgi:transmembrane protein 132